MKSSADLRTLLHSIDHKSYPAYKALAGTWSYGSFLLHIDHVQGDPFASPSSLHLELPYSYVKLPPAYFAKDCMRIALQDFLTRKLGQQFQQYNFKAKGSGKSGLLSISQCGQKVLERTACQLTDAALIVRFHVGFPAFGRTINAGELEKILFDFLPRCIENSLCYNHLNPKEVEDTVFLAEDQSEIRRYLKQEGFVAFVANGSILPRKSGVSELPLKGGVPFQSPASLEHTIHLTHRGAITGMAVPKGVTLIVGGGYHGKSTLLDAIQDGVYNHINGDGREFVITDATAVKLRAEDGRSIRNVDISLFINNLPNKKDTAAFTTEDASGSTSQAAGVIEGMEAGSHLFLMDEDTSATNFMVRDEFMQQVIHRDKEPITPFIERVRELYEISGISTIIVAGSSGAFFYIADHVLLMDCYHAVDITKRVKALCDQQPASPAKAPEFSVPDFRRILPGRRGQHTFSGAGEENDTETNRGHKRRNFQTYDHGSRRENSRINYSNSLHEHMKIKANGVDSFSLDKESVNIRYLEQLADNEQTTALAYLTRFCLEQALDGNRTVQEAVQFTMDILEKQGWDAFCSSYVPCGLAQPRAQELYACLNRWRG